MMADERSMEMFYHDPRLDAGLKNEQLSYMDDGGRPDLLDGSYERELASHIAYRPTERDTSVFDQLETDRMAVLQHVRGVVSIPAASKMRQGPSSLHPSKASSEEMPDLQHKAACSIDGCVNTDSTIWLLEKRNLILEVALVLLAIVLIFHSCRR